MSKQYRYAHLSIITVLYCSKYINREYDYFILGEGEFDERIFISENAPSEIGTPRATFGFLATSYESSPQHLKPQTPLSGKQYLPNKEYRYWNMYVCNMYAVCIKFIFRNNISVFLMIKVLYCVEEWLLLVSCVVARGGWWHCCTGWILAHLWLTTICTLIIHKPPSIFLLCWSNLNHKQTLIIKPWIQ